MAEYIEREEIRRAYEKLTRSYVNSDPYIADWRFDEMIESLPAADVAPVRHGRWIGCNGEIVDWDENNPGCPRYSCFCSICKSWLTASDEFPVTAYFCPNCGAKMDRGAD